MHGAQGRSANRRRDDAAEEQTTFIHARTITRGLKNV
jgi:hypothetical protein